MKMIVEVNDAIGESICLDTDDISVVTAGAAMFNQGNKVMKLTLPCLSCVLFYLVIIGGEPHLNYHYVRKISMCKSTKMAEMLQALLDISRHDRM